MTELVYVFFVYRWRCEWTTNENHNLVNVNVKYVYVFVCVFMRVSMVELYQTCTHAPHFSSNLWRALNRIQNVCDKEYSMVQFQLLWEHQWRNKIPHKIKQIYFEKWVCARETSQNWIDVNCTTYIHFELCLSATFILSALFVQAYERTRIERIRIACAYSVPRTIYHFQLKFEINTILILYVGHKISVCIYKNLHIPV